jgi:hypothetical protein
MDLQKARDAVRQKVDFLRNQTSGPKEYICVSVIALAGQLGVPPISVRYALADAADQRVLRMTTWRHDVQREVEWCESRERAFFYNPDDSNYVRLRIV